MGEERQDLAEKERNRPRRAGFGATVGIGRGGTYPTRNYLDSEGDLVENCFDHRPTSTIALPVGNDTQHLQLR